MTPFEDLSLLRAFVRIVESGSISAAARTLKIPQPSLSRHLRTLEERCGAALLRRDTHRMSLTEAGSRLLADAQAMLALADEAAQRLHEDQAALRGHLRLFATIDFGQFTGTRLITRFLLANPGVTAELGYTNRPLHMIQDGYDAGVIVGSITDDRVEARPAGKVVRYLVAAPGLVKKHPAPKAPADLGTWPWLALGGAQFGGAGQVTLSAPKHAEQTLRIAPVLVSEGVTSLREAARAGLGVAVLADWLAREDLVAGRLVRVLPQWNAPAFPVHVIYPGLRKLPARVRAFTDFAVTYLTTEMHVNT
ncbi:transcriptional regulator [Opitutaceae bacterium TAV1]|nr:transcriptional regulator [Opitutaceae bacterium TAV1]